MKIRCLVTERCRSDQTFIAYHAMYGWSHHWIDDWTKTEAYAYWEIEVLETANFQLDIFYNCSPENIGVELEVSTETQNLKTTINDAYISEPQMSDDRMIRDQEAPQKDWAMHSVGQIHLTKGVHQVKVKSLLIPGSKSIELKEIQLTKLD